MTSPRAPEIAPGIAPEITPDIDVAVIGAGVIGLAIAKELAEAGRDVVVIERNAVIGHETSSRNSEVIHAGIYYPPGSLKARLCVAGRKRLYQFAEDNAVPFQRTGKLIVATTPEEAQNLSAIADRAASNGVTDLTKLTETAAKAIEPALRCTAAMLSPSTGILDSHAFMQALEGHLTSRGGTIVLNTCVSAIDRGADGLFTLTWQNATPQQNGASSRLTARTVVAAAGHGMSDLMEQLPSNGLYQPPRTFLAKGHYFALHRKAPFKHLIYPVPMAGGLGIHLTLDLGGRARFGPDVQWIKDIDYSFDDGDAARRNRFVSAVRRYWPDLDADDLEPAYTGIRPKLSGPDEPAADFAIDGPAEHGVPNLVTLNGIESPGLTASLAIAEHVARLLAH